ncbi:hypothetical protein ACK6D9_23180 (plasmid) [Hoeflea sp. Naph1]|uniref:hypothetical protein n=1 Tax=Hoeflea sp. Naph1 TaxID=3388653 RepID=UPI00398F9567
MHQAARTLGRQIARIRRQFTPSSDRLKPEAPLRASDILIGMMLVILAIVLAVRLLVSLFGAE